ncbi:MAG: hypothetical protein ACYDAG_14360, partial [Chloroflexota bacterium]
VAIGYLEYTRIVSLVALLLLAGAGAAILRFTRRIDGQGKPTVPGPPDAIDVAFDTAPAGR